MQNTNGIFSKNAYTNFNSAQTTLQKDKFEKLSSNKETKAKKRLCHKKLINRLLKKRQNLLFVFVTVLIFVILSIVTIPQANAYSCSYQVPETDNIVLNVPFAIDVPFEFYKKRDTDNDSAFISQNKFRVRRDFAANRDFRSLRIFLYFDPVSINPLSVEKQIFINSSILPQAIGFWEQALLVRPTNAPIRLSRKCKSNHYYLDASETHPTCVDSCKEVTTCGEIEIPDKHLFQCRYCALPNPLSCTFSGPSNGVGVNDADFLLYVSAVNSQRCKSADTIAYAAHCQQEAELDRPIAGHVNICPSALSTHLHDQEILLSTIKHEILHALGFSAGLYAFFRHSDGRPRTKRNRYNRPLVFNRERGYYDADESTIKTIVRSDWWTAEDFISHSVNLMVTEKVVEEARKHSNCSTLEGAELENQGGDGTALTHWEKRLFENEAMTGTHTQNPVYSRLTLALMEDSGWYKANYSVAEHLHWGHNLGCEFVKKSCGDWIRTRIEKNMSTAPFCYHIKHDGRKSLATTRCTDQRDSLALCNLIPYKTALPLEYRNFHSLNGVRKEGIKYYGGSVELADFCPYNQEFEWKSVNSSDRRRDSRCELRDNAPLFESNHVMEVYGDRSKCFDLGVSWTERKCGRVKTYSQFMAGCYQFVCKKGRVHLKVFDTTKLYPCYYAGQPIYIRRLINGWLREGIIECPKCDEVCSAKHFWNSSNRNFSLTEIMQKTDDDLADSFFEENFIETENQISTTSMMPNQVGYERKLYRHKIVTSKPDVFSEPFQCTVDLLPAKIFIKIGDPLISEPCFALHLRLHIFKLFFFIFTLIILLFRI